MSDDMYSLVAIVSALASAVVLWLRARRARLLRRFMESLTDEQLETIAKSARQDESSSRAE